MLPAEHRMAVAVTLDFDAHSPWIGSYGTTSPSALSRGEFGVNVGVPRLLDLFRRLEITTTWATPGHDLVTFPRSVESVMAGGHEIAAHGCYHENITTLDREREEALMALQLEQHQRVVGRLPRGYRSPAWDLTPDTLQILEAAGFAWDSSLMATEFEPYRPRPVDSRLEDASTFGAPSSLVEIPVSWYLDDWPATEYVAGVSPSVGDHRAIFARWRDIFDYAYAQVPNAVYTLTLHPQCIGRAHHMAGLEEFLTDLRAFDDVWWPTLSQVCDAWLLAEQATPEATVPLAYRSGLADPAPSDGSGAGSRD